MSIYYDDNLREEWGLEVVGSIEWRDEAYEFDLTGVWVDAEHNLYYADDSGCSCPTPFEDIQSVSDLVRTDLRGLQRHLDSMPQFGGPQSAQNKQDVISLMKRAREAVSR